MKELENLENELKEDVAQPASVEFEAEATQFKPQQVEEPKEKAVTTVNMLQFGNVVCGAYCKISDLVYSKIKKGATPPDWDEATKVYLTDAINNYLSSLNIPMSPLVSLISTVIMCEVMRYAAPTSIKAEYEKEA